MMMVVVMSGSVVGGASDMSTVLSYCAAPVLYSRRAGSTGSATSSFGGDFVLQLVGTRMYRECMGETGTGSPVRQPQPPQARCAILGSLLPHYQTRQGRCRRATALEAAESPASSAGGPCHQRYRPCLARRAQRRPGRRSDPCRGTRRCGHLATRRTGAVLVAADAGRGLHSLGWK